MNMMLVSSTIYTNIPSWYTYLSKVTIICTNTVAWNYITFKVYNCIYRLVFLQKIVWKLCKNFGGIFLCVWRNNLTKNKLKTNFIKDFMWCHKTHILASVISFIKSFPKKFTLTCSNEGWRKSKQCKCS